MLVLVLFSAFYVSLDLIRYFCLCQGIRLHFKNPETKKGGRLLHHVPVVFFREETGSQPSRWGRASNPVLFPLRTKNCAMQAFSYALPVWLPWHIPSSNPNHSEQSMSTLRLFTNELEKVHRSVKNVRFPSSQSQ